jgi:hypothetical protein
VNSQVAERDAFRADSAPGRTTPTRLLMIRQRRLQWVKGAKNAGSP